MKDINKLIRHYVIEIIIAVAIVVVSYPVWQVFDKSEAASIAKSYAQMDYVYMDIEKRVSSVDFEDQIALINDTNTKRGYKLVVNIDKEKVTDDMIITINDNQIKAEDLKFDEDNDKYYYELTKGVIKGEHIDYTIRYLNSDVDYYDVEYQLIENHNV